MWKGWYGKEPFDLRLTALRLMYKLPLIAAVTFLGILVFGGGYYVKNVLLADRPSYMATSTFRVEYAVNEEKDVGTVYINEMSWNTYIQSDLFIDMLRGRLGEMAAAGGLETEAGDIVTSCLEMDSLELAGLLTAVLGSDLRVPAITVLTDDAYKSVLIARAAEAVMTQEFAREIREIVSISVIDSCDRAYEVLPDVRVGRALALSGILSCFFTVIILLLKETGDDSIWLPASLWRRYGLKTAGTLESREFADNIKYFFDGQASLPARRIALCGVQEQIDAEAALEKVRQACAGTMDIRTEEPAQEGKAGKGHKAVWFPVACPVRFPQVCEELRKADKILLAVQAGSHAGRRLERVLELLAQQDCQVTAAVLWDADEGLIRRYYGEALKGKLFRRKRAGEDGR